MDRVDAESFLGPGSRTRNSSYKQVVFSRGRRDLRRQGGRCAQVEGVGGK